MGGFGILKQNEDIQEGGHPVLPLCSKGIINGLAIQKRAAAKMIRGKVPVFGILLCAVLLLRFTGVFSLWLKEGVAEVFQEEDAPVFPSFSLESMRNQIQASSVMIDLVRGEKGREAYGHQESLPQPVKKYLNVFTTSGKVEFRKGLLKAGKYSDVLGPVLNEYGLPSEMLMLAYIESGFKMNARSRTNAVGPWQFMEATARRYGLRIDEHVDERVDFLKATHAAGRYLSDLLEEFGSLELTLAAYNTGERRVRSAIIRGGTTDFWTLASKGHFSRQTVNHVAKFSAAMLLTSDPKAEVYNLPI
jgi:membrane-bound lytic murein transglycosylase D